MANRFFEGQWLKHLRNLQPPRLFRSLLRQTLPTFPALSCCRGKMLLGTLSNHGNNPRRSQLSTFLDCPFQAIKLKDGKQQRDVSGCRGGNLFAQLEIDTPLADVNDAATTQALRSRNIEFLS